MKLVCQRWEESERNWGVRPDGFSLHRSAAELEEYLKAYWKEMPDAAPDEYSRPSGDPYECVVTDQKVLVVIELEGSFRSNNNDYPPRADGRKHVDGWRPAP